MADGWTLVVTFIVGLTVGVGLGCVDWFVSRWDAWDQKRTRARWQKAMAALERASRKDAN